MQAGTTSQQLAGFRSAGLTIRRTAVPARRAATAARCLAGGSNTSCAEPAAKLPLRAALARPLTAAAAAALLLLGGPAVVPPPAAAELSTITAQQATEMAKPLKPQQVNKGRIWLLFVLGATSLFGATVVLENNEAWFPAISRANRAMETARQAAEAREQAAAQEQAAFEARLAAVQQERAADAGVDAAVLAGLQEARKRSSDEEGASAAGPAAPTAAVAAQAATAAAPAAPAAVEAAAPAASSSETAAAEQASSESGGAGAEAPAAPAAAEVEAAAVQAEEQETRKPLFEISAEQIQASTEQRMQQLEAEVQRRKAAAAGAPPEA